MRLLFLVPLFWLAACSDRQSGTRGASVLNGEEAVSSSNANFYKRYSGTIAGKAVVVHLQKYGRAIQGYYSYVAIGEDILLHDWDTTPSGDGMLTLNEITPEARTAETKGALWTFRFSGNTITGTWSSGDSSQKYPIVLTEEYPEGSVALDAFRMDDSGALFPGHSKSPVATVSYSYLLPSGEPGSFLCDALKEQFIPAGAREGNVDEAVRNIMKRYLDDYRKENADVRLDTARDMETFSLSYSGNNAVYVHYNDNNWLVTELLTAYYTGGAHGNYGSVFSNIDLQEKKVWKLTDIIMDTAALRPLLNDAAIAYFGLKPGKGMEERLLVDEVPITDNAYVGARGLTFVYDPYEIASYGDGQISLYISYKRLLPLLTPSFKQRMKLGEQSGVAMMTILHKS